MPAAVFAWWLELFDPTYYPPLIFTLTDVSVVQWQEPRDVHYQPISLCTVLICYSKAYRNPENIWVHQHNKDELLPHGLT